jgi:alkanesulfonate monooxygenase SsuD/methylene tetrahydromethanopterin reductase-like flavin-dependent oxidoreductase (luciferase family)
MKFGALDHMDRGIVPIADQYEQRLKLIDVYEKNELFHAFHLTEHHGTPLGMAPSPTVFLAAVAQRTKRLRFGALVHTLAGYHPYRLFEELCMLDQMSRGRLELGIGKGVSPVELSFLGVGAEAPEIYAEVVEVLLRAFAGGTLNFHGKHFQFDNVPLVMEMYQQPHPPFWYGIGSPDTTIWAAKHRVNLMTNHFASEARALHDRYRYEWANAGNDPSEFPFFGSTKHIVVADTDEEAFRLGRSAWSMYSDHTTLLSKRTGVPRRRSWTEDFEEARAGGLIFAGSPTTVRDGLAKFVDESSINYLACRVAFGDLTSEQYTHSLDLLVDRVLPDLAEIEPAVA